MILRDVSLKLRAGNYAEGDAVVSVTVQSLKAMPQHCQRITTFLN